MFLRRISWFKRLICWFSPTSVGFSATSVGFSGTAVHLLVSRPYILVSQCNLKSTFIGFSGAFVSFFQRGQEYWNTVNTIFCLCFFFSIIYSIHQGFTFSASFTSFLYCWVSYLRLDVFRGLMLVAMEGKY